ncbi:MAG: hypothetical protein AAGG75_11425 [Bacteroidota bacterium]
MKPSYFPEETLDIKGTPVKVVSYQIGEKFYCHISNVDPGATIARAEGESREAAFATAKAKVESRL